jgi:cytochrome P450
MAISRAVIHHLQVQPGQAAGLSKRDTAWRGGKELAHLRGALLRLLRLADGAGAPFVFIPMFRVDLGRLSPWGRLVRDRREVGGILLAEIARRRAEGTAGRTDILSMLVDARDEDGAPMDDQELLDEMLTLLMAGHETTATSLAWVFYHVLSHDKVLETLRSELRTVVGEGALEPDHVGKLTYLDLVIKESARLTPVATNVLRILKRPMRIGGLELPAGVAVSAGIHATQHRPDLWPEPERFLPERFRTSRPSPYTFFPFGGGIRRCIGAAFATYEMKVVLAIVLGRAALRIAPGYRMRPVLRAVTIGPSRGMPVLLERRPRVSAAA